MSNITTPSSRKGNSSPGVPDEQRNPKHNNNATKFQEENGEDESDDEEGSTKPEKRAGRRKIKIEYIDDKSRRHITFSKRKAGIMKKAYELSTLTGTQVLLLVVSETGLVYTFTTPKLQPLVTKPEGKNLIQACLNAPDVPSGTESASPQRTSQQSSVYNENNSQVENSEQMYNDERKHNPGNAAYNNPALMGYNGGYGALPSQMPIGVNNQNYMNPAAYQQQYNQQHLYGAAANQYMPQTQANYGASGGSWGGNGQSKFSNQTPEKK